MTQVLQTHARVIVTSVKIVSKTTEIVRKTRSNVWTSAMNAWMSTKQLVVSMGKSAPRNVTTVISPALTALIGMPLRRTSHSGSRIRYPCSSKMNPFQARFWEASRSPILWTWIWAVSGKKHLSRRLRCQCITTVSPTHLLTGTQCFKRNFARPTRTFSLHTRIRVYPTFLPAPMDATQQQRINPRVSNNRSLHMISRLLSPTHRQHRRQLSPKTHLLNKRQSHQAPPQTEYVNG